MTNPTRVAHRGRLHPFAPDRLTALPALGFALLLLLALAGPALGAGPKLVNSVTDQAQALTAGEVDLIATRLLALRTQDGIQLFVALVDTTGSANVTDYTTALAEANSLGGNDALLLVAMQDRSDALWVGPSLGAVTNAEIDAILVNALEPRLADGDVAGAVIAAADALASAATVEVTPTPASATATPAGSGPGSGGAKGGLDITLILVLLVVVGGGVLVVRSFLKRRTAAKVAATEEDRLNREANRLLLQTDEALKDAANDVEFAAAQWGDAEVVPYRDALTSAGNELRAAFSIRQRLDDAEPETAAQRDALLREIVARTTAACQALDAQEKQFDQLQDLERTAPEQLAATGPAIEGLRARRAAAGTTLDRLTSSYALSATGSVTGNLSEADKAIDAAAAEAVRGTSLLDTQRHESVVALRRVQDGIARATLLVEAVERLATELDGAAAKLPDELAAARSDVDAARAATQQAGSGSAGPQAAGALAAADQALGEAVRAAGTQPIDPLLALQRAMAANAAADAIVTGIRAAEEQAKRRQQVADTTVLSARGHVTRAVDFITTRRHAVGQAARTRAAEAEALLAQATALAATDPEQATTAATRATQLADEAYGLAAAEFDAFDAGGGQVAGGAMEGMLGGGPRAGRGGWGGSPWGGSGGGHAGGSGWSGPSHGGGGGGSAGSGGGGGSAGGGGGGGRVRGGRW